MVQNTETRLEKLCLKAFQDGPGWSPVVSIEDLFEGIGWPVSGRSVQVISTPRYAELRKRDEFNEAFRLGVAKAVEQVMISRGESAIWNDLADRYARLVVSWSIRELRIDEDSIEIHWSLTPPRDIIEAIVAQL